MQLESVEVRHPQSFRPHGFEVRNVTEFVHEFSEACRFRDLSIACQEGDPERIDPQSFNNWVVLTRTRAQRENPAIVYFSPLQLAAAYGHVAVVKKLLDLSALKSKEPNVAKVPNPPWDVNLKSSHPDLTVTALDFACKYNHPEVVSLLLDAGANPAVSTPHNNWLEDKTPLMWCIQNEMNFKLIQRMIALLKKGDTLNARSQRPAGNALNALELAIYLGAIPVVRELLLSGAKPNQTRILEGGLSQTPLSLVLSFPSSTVTRDLAELLLVFGGVTSINNNPKSFSTSAESYQQAQPLYRNFISDKNPGFLICRAAHRLIEIAKARSRAGDQEPTNLLRKLLEYLPQRQLLVVKYLRLELQREESGWLNSKTKLALNPKSFHNVLLQVLSQDASLLQSLNIRPVDVAQFEANPAIQSEFLENLLNQLKAFLASSNCFSTPTYSQPQ